jgi:hypothetical protein
VNYAIGVCALILAYVLAACALVSVVGAAFRGTFPAEEVASVVPLAVMAALVWGAGRALTHTKESAE